MSHFDERRMHVHVRFEPHTFVAGFELHQTPRLVFVWRFMHFKMAAASLLVSSSNVMTDKTLFSKAPSCHSCSILPYPPHGVVRAPSLVHPHTLRYLSHPRLGWRLQRSTQLERASTARLQAASTLVEADMTGDRPNMRYKHRASRGWSFTARTVPGMQNWTAHAWAMGARKREQKRDQVIYNLFQRS